MDLFSVTVGFVIGVAVSVLAPKAWAKIHAGGAAVADWITRPRDRA